MKVLVTGATGFIGSYLTEALLRRGHEVTCLVRRHSDRRWIEHLDLDFIECDLSDVKSCADRLDGFHYVYHLAGRTKAVSETDFFRANADGTLSLLNALAAAGPPLKRFVYVSSLAAAGPCRDGVPIKETAEPAPVSYYGKSKLAGERHVKAMGQGFPATIIRPPAVYGPRDTDFLVMFKMVKKGVFPFWGRCVYSILYVEDLVRGIMAAAEDDRAAGETFFLGGEDVHTNEEIAAEMASALGSTTVRLRLPKTIMPAVAFLGEKMSKKGIINRDKMRELSFANWSCDAGKAEEVLGFKSRITLREGIKWTADWYRIHRWL